MPKAKKPKRKKEVEALRHDEASRKHIPTAEYQSLLASSEQELLEVRYPRSVGGLEKEKDSRNRDLDPQLVWRGKDEKDWSDLVVPAPPLFIQEKIHPKVLIDDLMRRSAVAAAEKASSEPGHQPDLFADFNGIVDPSCKTEFYQHDANWSNRMILGDSLQVMASLAEREGLHGRVQCIYMDPPYGIKFNSNFQWSTTSRDAKDGNSDHITREPEQVKAFRDTWRDGIHSYLSYLRDRLTVARDLLTESGSIFVQIGDENVHRVRALLDEVFGDQNFIVQLAIQKTGSQTGDFVQSNIDSVLWYSKKREACKFRPLFVDRELGGAGGSGYSNFTLPDGRDVGLADSEAGADASLDPSRIWRSYPLTSDGYRETTTVEFEFQGRRYFPGQSRHWGVVAAGLARVGRAGRLVADSSQVHLKRYFGDSPSIPIGPYWTDIGGVTGKIYVVQTNLRVVQRCVLMATDPGDLILDPTCGSGTTALVAEQWGRRWITIDTSRVALALTRARIMGSRHPFYLLADSKEGQQKEAEVAQSEASTAPTHRNVQHGFVYERVPHITLKSIANNAEIDVIWEKFQATLEPLRTDLNSSPWHEVGGVVNPARDRCEMAGEGQDSAREMVGAADRSAAGDGRVNHD